MTTFCREKWVEKEVECECGFVVAVVGRTLFCEEETDNDYWENNYKIRSSSYVDFRITCAACGRKVFSMIDVESAVEMHSH